MASFDLNSSSFIKIIGEEEEISTFLHYLLNYKKLIGGEISKDDILSYEKINQADLIIENKYYHASLSFRSVSIEENNFEGLIFLSSQKNSVNIDDLNKKLSNEVKNNLSLSLLVDFRPDDNLNEEFLVWTVDNNFEYINIDETNPIQDHDSREKIYLPRVLEAMESNMWSSMKKKSNKKEEKFEETINKNIKNELIKEDDILLQNKINNEINDEIKKEQDKEFDDELNLEDFSDLLLMANSIREKALSGKLSDEERKKNAENMAQMMSKFLQDFDEDSD